VRHGLNRLFQVQAQSQKYAPARGKAVLRERQGGRIEIEYRGRKLPRKERAAASRHPPWVAAVSGCGLCCALNAPHSPTLVRTSDFALALEISDSRSALPNRW
jgi:hypothetical protein